MSGLDPKLWRRWFVALCAFGVVLSLAQTVLSVTVGGSLGLRTQPTGVPFVYRILAPLPHGSVRAGDLVNERALPAPDRWLWYYGGLLRRQSYAFVVTRNGRPVRVSVIARAARYFGAPFTSVASWPYWLANIGQLWMIGFAFIVGWRRPESREARVLALLLVLIALDVVLTNWRIGPPAITALLYLVGYASAAVGGALVAAYPMLFRPASRARTLFAWSAYALQALTALAAFGWTFAVWTAAFDPGDSLLSGPVVLAVVGAAYVFAVLCGAFAIAETRGAERARLSWTMASLGLFSCLDIAAVLVSLVAPGDVSITYMLGNTALFIAPLGLTYGLLNRKLLDVGFALNRAAIFTAVSIVVVGIFVLVEWAFGEWLRDASHAANVAISGGLALLLGFSVRFVHGRVEHVVDNVFFRKRHEDEAALRAFAHEAGYVNSADTLVQRTIAAIERHADASSVQLAVDDGRGRYGDVDEDDPAIVALRAWHRAVDLHVCETALQGEMAFPMVARGRFVGALVLGPKRSGETYAPDESDAIMQVAQSVGTSLAVLDRKPDADGDVLDEIRALRAEMKEELRELGLRTNGAVPEAS